MTTSDVNEISQLEEAIAALESQRPVLGDAVVDTSIAALREKLGALQPPSPPTQQRKLVTVLFTDIVESTRISQGLDPEDVIEIVDGALQRLAVPVAEHGGQVTRFMGDGFKAIFGLPLAHENDPEQAILAGLDILEVARSYAAELEAERGISGFTVRVGINTGLVVAGGYSEAGDTVMGLTVNLAARLESAAPPGGLLISHHTYQHVRGVFSLELMDPIRVKGFSEPVPVYLVLQARPRAFRLGRRGVEGVETRMIGRQAELNRLQEALYTTMRDGGRQMITITGEAGVGKSRLLYEFVNWVDLLPETVLYFKGQARMELQSVPYALLRDLFSFRFLIQDSDSVQVVKEKIERGIGQMLGEDEVGRMKAHLIGHLLGFDFSHSPHLQAVRDDPQQVRDRALIYLSDYFKAATEKLPTVILLEDVHWADGSSLDALDHLALTMPTQRLLVVCLARPTLFERRPGCGERQTYHNRLELQPLSKQDGCRLVEEILQKAEQVPDTLRDLVVDGAEGNPFYIEELIKMLIEEGVIVKGEERWQALPVNRAEIRVPPTLTGVLQARLDSLPLEERTILQEAAVVGRTFWDNAVVRVSEMANQQIGDHETGIGSAQPKIEDILHALRGKEMVFRREISAFAGTQEYLFKHALLREVAYESVLKRVRRIFHAIVAEWLIEQGGERAGEYTGLIADHLELAGQTERAVAYMQRAGEGAAARFANAEAVSYFNRALAQYPEDDLPGRYALTLAREKVNDLQGDREAQIDDLADLERLAEVLDDDQKRAEVALRQSRYAFVTGDYSGAISAARAATRLNQEAKDKRNEAATFKLLGIIAGSLGNYDEARQQLHRALAMYRASDDQYGIASTLNDLGIVADRRGEYAEAKQLHHECLAIRQQIDHQWGIGNSLLNLGYLAYRYGKYTEAKSLLEESLVIQREIGDQYQIANCLSNLGAAVRALGEYEAAHRYFSESLRFALVVGAVPLILEVVAEMARLLATRQPAERERAAQLFTLALHHPASDKLTQETAKRGLDGLASQLPPEVTKAAQNIGIDSELELVVTELLDEALK